jgi:hypothetical protein
MGVMAAVDAWKAAGPACVGIALERIGLLLASGFGPHCRGFKFLDGLIDEGDGATSPTDFSHSVHGAACAYISALLDVRGPSLTVTDFEIGFEQAVQLGQCWLAEGACDRVLLGAVDELGEVMLYCAPRMLAESSKVNAGEGAMFMVLGPEGMNGGIARIDATVFPGAVDLLIDERPIIEFEQGNRMREPRTPEMQLGESLTIPKSISAGASHSQIGHTRSPWVEGSRLPAIAARDRVSVTSHFGYSASGAAFGILAGLLTMRKAQAAKTIDSTATLRTSSDGRVATLLVERI